MVDPRRAGTRRGPVLSERKNRRQWPTRLWISRLSLKNFPRRRQSRQAVRSAVAMRRSRQEERAMARNIAVLSWLVLSLIAVAPRAASACSCMSRGPACQAFWKTDAVFDATVVGIRPLNQAEPLPAGQVRFADKIVTLDVRQSWKGVEPGPLEVTTSGKGGSCGFPFKEGGRYLVFAYHGRRDARLEASICSLTQEFNGSGVAADFLRALDAPARGGRIFGTVRTAVRVFDSDRSNAKSPPKRRCGSPAAPRKEPRHRPAGDTSSPDSRKVPIASRSWSRTDTRITPRAARC